MYDLAIIGGGPGGVSAGIYAARKKIRTALITDAFGGQSLTSSDVQNWIGTVSVSGLELSHMLESHLRAQEGIDIFEGDRVTAILETPGGTFSLETKNGKHLEARNLLMVTGSRRKKLNVPGEHEFEGRGVAYCSICDAPLFRGKNVAVAGGGNAGLEAVLDLLPYAEKIYLLERNGALRGDRVTQERISRDSKVTVVMGALIQKISGTAMVDGLTYTDAKTEQETTLPVQGIFVEIGIVPNSELVRDLVNVNELGAIAVDHLTQRTSHPRIWAAGDVSDALYRQNNISAGDSIKAVLNIYEALQAAPVGGHAE